MKHIVTILLTFNIVLVVARCWREMFLDFSYSSHCLNP